MLRYETAIREDVYVKYLGNPVGNSCRVAGMMILEDDLDGAQDRDQNCVGNKQRCVVERKIGETFCVALQKIIWHFVENDDGEKSVKGRVGRSGKKDIQIYTEYFSFQ